MINFYGRGFNAVVQNLHKRALRLRRDQEKLGEIAGRIIERRAKENITGQHGHNRHIITGNLRRSIDTRIARNGLNLITVSIGTDVYYGWYVETRDRTGGFLYPAFKETKDEALLMLALLIRGETIK